MRRLVVVLLGSALVLLCAPHAALPDNAATELEQTSDAPAGGREPLDPGAKLTLKLRLKAATPLRGAVLVEVLPDGWTVVDSKAGDVGKESRSVSWDLGALAAESATARSLVVRAPVVHAQAGTPPFRSTFAAHLSHDGGIVRAEDLVVLVSHSSARPSPSPSPTPNPPPSQPKPSPPPDVTVDLEQSSDAPAAGRHRIDPGDLLMISIRARPSAAIQSAVLVESFPAGWTVVESRRGVVDRQRRTITWELGPVSPKSTATRSVVLRAPLESPAGEPAFEATFSARLTFKGGSARARDLTVLVSPAIVMAHRVIARIADPSFVAHYLPPDQPMPDAQQLERLRIRFQLRNADTIPVTLTPQLEFRRGEGRYGVLPAGQSKLDVEFYAAREWIRPPELDGLSRLGPEKAEIPPGELRMRDRDDPGQDGATGVHSMGVNPLARLRLPPRSYTEVEFTVGVTMDAEYLAAYEFRLTDEGSPLQGALTAKVRLREKPPLELSPGQKAGRRGDDDDRRRARRRRAKAANASTSLGKAPRFRLVASASGAAQPRALAAFTLDAHGPYSTVADQCAICHRAHVGRNRNLLTSQPAQSALCFTCHDGTGASTNVSAQYSDGLVPANNASTREYYRHDALVASSHTQARLNEFGGTLNRHSECGDCHNPHAATSGNSTQTASGWTASGRLAAISGVSVTNGASGTSPTYTFRDGSPGITLEYQLCFKCHSGFTQLMSNTGFTPSKHVLDKGTELNPANPSYHPVEAAGKNATQKMTDSLNGTSPYKQWTFTVTSTIRCANCHATYTKYNGTTPPAAGSDLSPHTSRYRGILLQNYVDRVLKSSAAVYAAADFALCYMCHGEAPFASGGSTIQTNFRDHRLHVGNLAGKGSGGTNIDVLGDGQGNALCAECHFRIHSTTYKDGTQTLTGSRLVNFAPNVRPNGSTRSWTKGGSVDTGTCTLTCHGKSHSNQGY